MCSKFFLAAHSLRRLRLHTAVFLAPDSSLSRSFSHRGKRSAMSSQRTSRSAAEQRIGPPTTSVVPGTERALAGFNKCCGTSPRCRHSLIAAKENKSRQRRAFNGCSRHVFRLDRPRHGGNQIEDRGRQHSGSGNRDHPCGDDRHEV